MLPILTEITNIIQEVTLQNQQIANILAYFGRSPGQKGRVLIQKNQKNDFKKSIHKQFQQQQSICITRSIAQSSNTQPSQYKQTHKQSPHQQQNQQQPQQLDLSCLSHSDTYTYQDSCEGQQNEKCNDYGSIEQQTKRNKYKYQNQSNSRYNQSVSSIPANNKLANLANSTSKYHKTNKQSSIKNCQYNLTLNPKKSKSKPSTHRSTSSIQTPKTLHPGQSRSTYNQVIHGKINNKINMLKVKDRDKSKRKQPSFAQSKHYYEKSKKYQGDSQLRLKESSRFKQNMSRYQQHYNKEQQEKCMHTYYQEMVQNNSTKKIGRQYIHIQSCNNLYITSQNISDSTPTNRSNLNPQKSQKALQKLKPIPGISNLIRNQPYQLENDPKIRNPAPHNASNYKQNKSKHKQICSSKLKYKQMLMTNRSPKGKLSINTHSQGYKSYNMHNLLAKTTKNGQHQKDGASISKRNLGADANKMSCMDMYVLDEGNMAQTVDITRQLHPNPQPNIYSRSGLNLNNIITPKSRPTSKPKPQKNAMQTPSNNNNKNKPLKIKCSTRKKLNIDKKEQCHNIRAGESYAGCGCECHQSCEYQHQGNEQSQAAEDFCHSGKLYTLSKQAASQFESQSDVPRSSQDEYSGSKHTNSISKPNYFHQIPTKITKNNKNSLKL